MTWNEDNRELKAARDKDRHYKNKYGKVMREQFGIDGQEGYDYLREQQDYKCGLCKTHEDEIKESGMPKLVHDHDHETGEIRALVCLSCNTAIGGYENVTKIEEYKKYFGERYE
jgi:hypothetical protein|tara:strand:- start:222 stop:563 length:342 start_codon:yes stop_codon:yes gene_type:complete